MDKDTCSVEGCDRPAKTRGFCQGHYQRVWRTGSPGPAELSRPSWDSTECRVDGCDRPVRTSGYCQAHYLRVLRHGDPGGPEHRNDPRPAECSVDGCDLASKSKGYCSMHYARVKATGEAGPVGYIQHPQNGPCSVDDCDRPARTRGYCDMHYKRVWKHDDPDHGLQWDPDSVSYYTIHVRIRKQRGSARNYPCDHCSGAAANWAYDHTDQNPKYEIESGLPYSFDLDRYFPLCVPCHRRFDYEAAGRKPA